MDIFLYFMIFIMGTFFGSFFTLAVYRIPLKKDITHEHSFCPNCNHKLGILDLIPVVSYLCLRGKCRYCGKKVRIRYFLLEVLSGIIFVIGYASLNIQNIILENEKLIYFVNFVFLYTTLILIAGIDKEYRKINQSVVLFGGICQIIYMLYLYIIGKATMYRYIIYTVIFMVLWTISKISTSKRKSYCIEIILLFSYILLALDFKNMILILVLSLIFCFMLTIVLRKKHAKIKDVPFGFMISICTIVYVIAGNFIKFYVM